jgi:nucleoside-diphosphate-sugar epimerase
MNSKVLITGAGGFIGRHLVARLISEGSAVHVLWRSTSKRMVPESWGSIVKVYVWDESTESLIKIVNEVRPEIVIHVASLFIAEHNSSQVDALIQTNVLFGTRLLEAMTRAGVTRLVNFGTSWQHFQNEPYNPVCLYAATKQAFEAIIRYYVEAKHIRVITLKLFDTFGLGDDRGKLFSALMRAMETGEPMALSRGEQVVDFAYVDDVIEATVLAAERILCDEGRREESFGISGGCPMSLREFVTMVSAVAGRPINVNWGGRPYRSREVMVPWTDYPRLPGWTPQVALSDGIRRVVSGHV